MGSFASESFGFVGASDVEGPAIERARGKSFGLMLNLGIDFFVNSRNAEEDRGLDFEQGLRELFDEGTVSKNHTVVEEGQIRVPGGYMRQRKKGNTDFPGAKFKALQRSRDIR